MLKPPSPAQVRLPGLGELGAFCLLAAQCGCTSPPFGYRTNAGSEKGCWHSWQSFWSESQMALPLSFICKRKELRVRLAARGSYRGDTWHPGTTLMGRLPRGLPQAAHRGGNKHWTLGPGQRDSSTFPGHSHHGVCASLHLSGALAASI